MGKESYRPILETDRTKVYQKKHKTLMVGEKEFIFQTDERILKRARKEPEPKPKENKFLRIYKKGFNKGFIEGKKSLIFDIQEFLEGKQPNSEEGFYLINELYNKVDFLKEEMEENERK